MTKMGNNSLEIQSNKKTYHWALRFLFAFCIVWFTGLLGLLIYEFFFNPEEIYEIWVYIPVTIWGLISITLIITFTWALISKNSKYKSITITSPEWRIETHKGKIITIPTSSISSIRIRIARNFSAYLLITKRRIRLRIKTPKRKFRLNISIRSKSQIFPCLLESYVPMSIVERSGPYPTGELEILKATAQRIAMLLEQPDYALLRNKIEFVGDLAHLENRQC